MPLPPLNSDFKDLLAVFNRHRVRYLVVGGFAVMRYTEPRYTKDLDLWIETTPQNAKRVYAALAEFGGPLSGFSPEDFAGRYSMFQIGVAPVRVDILGDLPGVRFSSAWPKRVRTKVDEGLFAPFISRLDLIKAKRAAGRRVDKDDVDWLLGRT